MRYRTYFFDFDGVIVDSHPIKTEAFGSLFTEYGPDIVRKVKEYHLNNGGVSRYEKFRYYYEVLLNKPVTQQIIDEMSERFSQKVKERIIAVNEIKGVSRFLKVLQQEGKEVFVVSATPGPEVRDIVHQRGMDAFFREVIGSPAKKDENLGMLMEKYGIETSDAVFFGDAQSDYDAAQKYGIDFVAVMSDSNQHIFRSKEIRKIDDFEAFISKDPV